MGPISKSKFNKPENENYCCTIIKIKNVIPFENSDFIQGTTIFGNPVIIGKDTNIGDVGVYFPAETQLSHEFTSYNNLYKHSENNSDPDKKGYLEDNRRIRTMKMRGNKSCGLFLPLESLAFLLNSNEFEIGDTFDEIKGIKICNKYVVERKKSQSQKQGKKKSKTPKISKLINGQFRFHDSTSQFGKNAHRFSANDIIDISYKMHGTSAVISKILCKKKLNWFYKFLKKIKIEIIDTIYDNIYSSRKVIKNDDLNKSNHYYNVDIWGLANEKLKDFLSDGMTIYAEIVGFLPEGRAIQKLKKAYDYGCEIGTFDVYIYRITYTNTSGDVFEFSAKQVQDWCKERGLNAVPELYHGRLGDIFEWKSGGYSEYYDGNLSYEDNLINVIREKFLEKDCFMCKNKVPAEGVVIRKESNSFEAFKFKSFKFLEDETKQLDIGEIDIEEEN